MTERIKTAARKILHAAGFELRRIDPGSEIGTSYKFGPSNNDKFNWVRNLNISTVLDVGANKGQFATYIHKILPDAMIYAFEPLKDCFERLVDTMKDAPNFKAFDFALGNEASEVEMHRSNYSPSSSILQMADLHKVAFPFTGEGVLEKISVKRLDDIAGSLKIIDNLLVKIDVQGFEDRVFAGGPKTIRRAKVLIVETSFKSLYEGQPLFDSIYEKLKEMGFAHHGNFSQVLNPIDGSVLQADGIFIKSEG